MAPTIECCLCNVDSTRSVPSTARTAPCLDHCETCRSGAFLVIDGRVVTGPNHAAILDR